MQYYLGIDIGTTSAKAVAFSPGGQMLVSQSCFYTMFHPANNQSEQDPDKVLEAVVESCNHVVEAMAGAAPAFVAFSSAMHSIMAVDVNGKPLTNCIIWADNRAAQIAEDILSSERADYFYHTTGVPVHAMSPLCKLIWLRRYEPVIFANAYKFIGIKEYVCLQLTGEYLVDTSIASSTGLLNIATLKWEQEILDHVEITAASLSTLVSPKHITYFNKNGFLQHSLLVPAGTKLVVGGSDGTLANLGTGSADGNSMVVNIGTSSAARMVTNMVETDCMMRTFCYHLKDELYVVGGPSNNGAIVLQWLKEKILETSESYPGLFSKAEKIEPGCESLLFLPYILGERAPVWNSNARGVFFGLNINHTGSHLIRACMEGIVFSVYSIAKIILEKRTINGIHATGGFAQGGLWLQMLADVCNTPVFASQAMETSALGAVMLGIEALDLPTFPAKQHTLVIEPNPVAHAIYMNSYKRFESLYASLNREWVKEESYTAPMFL